MRICLVSHGQPGGNPRLVRDANALARAGHDVRVVTPRYVKRWIAGDHAVLARATWQYRHIDLIDSRKGRLRWQFVRTRRWLAAGLARWTPIEAVVGRGCNYANPELASVAASENADLYIAHQQHSLPAASWAARRQGVRYALDAQDLLADCSSESHHLAVQVERHYIGSCLYVSTMSEAAAERLQKTNRIATQPIVLHNVPELCERADILPPSQRPCSDYMSLYWFGQTIGPHSRADQVLKALPQIHFPVKLILRGHPKASYIQYLDELARSLGVQKQLEILPPASPDEMVKLASHHDVLLGTQPGNELFNQLAIGNKVFTGMMAGLALALTDTVAHRSLLSSVPGAGFLIPDDNVDGLVAQLNTRLKSRESINDMKSTSWLIAGNKYNWDVESKRLLAAIELPAYV